MIIIYLVDPIKTYWYPAFKQLEHDIWNPLILTKLHPCNTASTIPATNEAQFRLPVQRQNDKFNTN